MLKAAREDCGLPEDKCFASIEAALKAVECDAVVITANLEGHILERIQARKIG